MNIVHRFIFATFATLILLIVLAATGWLASFLTGIEPSGNDISDFDMFLARLFVGVLMLGILNGISKICDFFIMAFKAEKKAPRGID